MQSPSRSTSREVRLDRRGDGLLHGQGAVSATRRRAERLLRLVSPAGISPRQARSPTETARPRVVRGEQVAVRRGPRIYEDLFQQDVGVSRKRVIRLMHESGLRARHREGFTCTTMSHHDQPVAANLLHRQLTPRALIRRWVRDGVRDRATAASCTDSRPRSVLAFHDRLRGECR
jgi:helix-turn-helix protein